ncbi:16S rRNA (cytidine(1402)-2'-O)-methyltransferase [Paenibacillus sp. F411]|uniref:Ribosomal RNA small subunit methyltransferase I n=1 Tax=Paenibacillus algicola TaxID=2565926 RepID=A0A4P8XHI6_9BACL|nr:MULTISPECIES: 16S rRNA (cytidine(1402)-2'-O)-methyltransferase [Paenibacillus]MBO2945928.1 16S rRNA (cytidine(1402)-2'-O)-methyltransferase [Paenibacillus sp. F411]QCT00751.1 Uroporphyrin-III C/tetrapyrrole (Corrin/Porphyrin) methyltransferase [Paenibacillus algicola]
MSISSQSSFQSPASEGGPGALYLVATPIGNLEDMTYRAVRTLSECDIIAAEDTRQTRKLLTHFDIQPKQLFSYHEHNKGASGPEIIRYIIEGKNAAIVSDAGLPAISDPGSDLVRLAIAEGIPVIPVPGANAALSALIASGLSTERFTFIGFLPREKKDAVALLQSLPASAGSLLFYESPHRIKKTLSFMQEALGHRRAVLARELTKRYEEFTRGTLQECMEWLEEHPPIGEYCVVLEGGSQEEEQKERDSWWQSMSIEDHVAHYEETGLSRKDAMKKVASDRGVSKRDIYNALL